MKETTLQAKQKRDSSVLLTILRATGNILLNTFRISVNLINKIITAIWTGFVRLMGRFIGLVIGPQVHPL